MTADDLRASWAKPGFVVPDEDVAKVPARLAALPPITDEQHARNLEWLRQFDSTPSSRLR